MLDTPFQEEPRCRGKMHCLADEFLAVETKLREEVGELNTLLQMALQEHSEECSAHDRTKEEVRKLQSMLTEIAYAKARMHTLSMNRTNRWVLDTGVPAEYGEGELQYKPTFVKAYNGLPEHIQTATKMTLFQFVMQEPLRLRQMLNVKRVLSNPRNQRKTVHDWVCDVQHTTYRMVFRKQDSTIAFLYVGEHSHVY
jgi:hypothetical protein